MTIYLVTRAGVPVKGFTDYMEAEKLRSNLDTSSDSMVVPVQTVPVEVEGL